MEALLLSVGSASAVGSRTGCKPVANRIRGSIPHRPIILENDNAWYHNTVMDRVIVVRFCGVGFVQEGQEEREEVVYSQAHYDRF